MPQERWPRQLQETVRANASLSLRKIQKTGGKGLFVDCGSNLGQAFTFFREHYPQSYYDYVLIEPNPNCFEFLLKIRETHKTNTEIIDAAASTKYGEANFYGLVESEGGKTAYGGSILKVHNSLFYAANEQKAIRVRTFSLKEFMLCKIQLGYSSIVLKMDIEGSEYEVLEDLINHKIHRRLDALYIEFHSQYMEETDRKHYQEKEISLLTKLRRDGVSVTLWI